MYILEKQQRRVYRTQGNRSKNFEAFLKMTESLGYTKTLNA